MKKLEYIEFSGSAAIDTGIYTDANTEVECWVIPVATTYTYWDCFFGAQKQDDGNDTFQLRRYDRQYNWVPLIQSSKPSGSGVGSIVNGDEYHIIMNKTGFTVNDTNLWTPNPTTNYTSLYTLYFGATHNNQGIFRPYNSKWIRFIVRNNGTLQGDFTPVLDGNDEPCFYDSVSGNYFYKTGNGTFTAGPLATTITTEPDNVSFDSTGGSESVTVYSTEGNWTANTQNLPYWLTVSPTTGANGDSLTISAAPITSSGQQSRVGFFNISNQEDAAQITFGQEGTGDLIFRNFIMFNDRGLNKEYLETNNVKKMFYNGREVFRRVSFTPSLSLSTNSLKFRKTGGTDTVEITSNTTWTATTSASWLTITTAATGISVTAADYSTGETERYATILVTASNGDMSVQSVVSVVQKIGGLPDVPFMFNYNAKEYDSETGTFPKTEGQLFDQDIVLRGTPGNYVGPDYVKFNYGTYYGYTWTYNSDNPFNRNANNNSFTFIYKTSGFTSGSENLFANRANNYNYMVRGNMFHTNQSGYLPLTPNADPQICVIRIPADGTECVRKFVDAQGNTLQSVSASGIDWGYDSNGIGFFAGYASGGELFYDNFYWMYCSLQTLTDEEIQAVIDYNESL